MSDASRVAIVTGALVGPAVAGTQGVDVITVSATPLHASVWQPGVVPALANMRRA